MKKFLFVAALAIAFVACNQNEAGTPNGDKKAIAAASVDAAALVGQAPAAVDKALKAAGYTKLEVPAEEAKLPKFAGKFKAPQFKAEDENATYEYYGYGVPGTVMDDATEAKLYEQVKNGKSIVVVMVMYVEDKMYMIETSYMTGLAKDVNLIYTETSDKLYKLIPENAAQTMWQGYIGETAYKAQTEYVAAIAAAEAVEAYETGAALLTMDPTGFVYVGMWVNPDEETQAEMQKTYGVAYVLGQFMVGDIMIALQ